MICKNCLTNDVTLPANLLMFPTLSKIKYDEFKQLRTLSIKSYSMLFILFFFLRNLEFINQLWNCNAEITARIAKAESPYMKLKKCF